ncbi:MAG TPA: aspartate aminotransferase family protein [Spirochaetia bacterium]|nr:aspartate aminotransferase family protein [Spirochaetia bacterium]
MKYNLTPTSVPEVHTKNRTIRTSLPVPESIEILRSLMESEPRSMLGQPPVIWDRAEGASVWDRWGNRWIDWSSGVLIANAGHGRPEIQKAMIEMINRPLLSTYVFVHEKRQALARALQQLAPDPAHYKVFILTTGSEAVENCIKLARTYALERHGPERKYLVSFRNAFHGRTLGAQLVGGIPGQKKWIVGEGSTFIQVPFPDGYKNEDTSFDLFTRSIEEKGVRPEQIAGIITEAYQGVGPDFLPVAYAQSLEQFCRRHDIVMIYDEVQSGFGRTGKMFCYEHYGVTPDLIACGKGISSSLPLSAVIGREDIMDQYPPGSMTSTHSASPLPVVAAIESLRIIREEKLAERAASFEPILMESLRKLQAKFPDRLGCVHGKGLVAGIQVVKSGTKIPDSATALAISEACFQKGLLMFAPVGIAGECLKIAPPLVISEDALLESLSVFGESCTQVLSQPA